MTYKTRQEVLRAAADWMDVCEKAGITANCKYDGDTYPLMNIVINNYQESYEFPIALLEGKEVWVGDELWSHSFNQLIKVTGKHDDGYLSFEDKSPYANADIRQCSWNPPKPKTVLVPLLVEDAEFLSNPFTGRDSHCRIAEACKKALEELK